MTNERRDQPACSLRPSAMFGQEHGADVEFEVGPDGGTWRLTAHRCILAATNPVMRAELCGSLRAPEGNVIRVDDVDPRAFECLLRHLYGKAPQPQTVQTALATLYVAHKYLCPGLEWECAAFLDQQIRSKPDIVLDVFLAVSFYCGSHQRHIIGGLTFEPTAPPAEEIESDSEGSRLMHATPSAPVGSRRGSSTDPQLVLGEASRLLYHNCLQVIDQNADLVLDREQLEDLDRDSLLAVLGRNTLAVSCELMVLAAAERWAECECKRRKLPYESHHLREVLGGPEVVCGGRLARLLLLTPQQFATISRSMLLSCEEQRAMLIHLVGPTGDPQTRPPPLPGTDHIKWALLSTPRFPGSPQFIPILSRQATNGGCGDVEGSEPTKRRRWGLRWPRSKRKSPPASPQRVQDKQPRRQSKQKAVKASTPPPTQSQSGCSKTFEFCISVIACLFD